MFHAPHETVFWFPATFRFKGGRNGKGVKLMSIETESPEPLAVTRSGLPSSLLSIEPVLAARNAALNNLNAAENVAQQADDLVNTVMEGINTAQNAGASPNSAVLVQLNQSLTRAFQLQGNAVLNLANR